MPKRPLTPGDIIQVVWEDITFSFDSLTTPHDDPLCYTVGYLVSSTKTHIELAGEIGSAGVTGPHRASFRIPRSVVRKITVLRRV
jgi:hypothetical protein